jgi:hypothetical protein
MKPNVKYCHIKMFSYSGTFFSNNDNVRTYRFGTHAVLGSSDLKLKTEMINGYLVFPGKVLCDTCQERLREIKS